MHSDSQESELLCSKQRHLELHPEAGKEGESLENMMVSPADLQPKEEWELCGQCVCSVHPKCKGSGSQMERLSRFVLAGPLQGLSKGFKSR